MLITGIAGGSGTGKSSIILALEKQYPPDYISVISMDCYYNYTSHLSKKERLKINFDHPDAFDTQLLISHLSQLKKGNTINCPTYSYLEMNRLRETTKIKPSPVIILEGLYPFMNTNLISLIDLKIFLDASEKTRLSRIISRDMLSRNRSEKEVRTRFTDVVNPMHKKYVEQQKSLADIVMDNNKDIESCTEQIKSIINQHVNYDT